MKFFKIEEPPKKGERKNKFNRKYISEDGKFQVDCSGNIFFAHLSGEPLLDAMASGDTPEKALRNCMEKLRNLSLLSEWISRQSRKLAEDLDEDLINYELVDKPDENGLMLADVCPWLKDKKEKEMILFMAAHR